MQYMHVHVLYFCHYIIVCVWCMQCIIMPLYNACYDSCGCILCMHKINNVHVCTCVCASVCVCMCASTMFMCVHVCVHGCQCVCVCACPVCTNQLQSLQAQRVTIAATSLSLILGSYHAANAKEERAEKVHQLSPGHVCIYDYIKWRQLTIHHTITSKQSVRITCFPCSGLEVFEFGTWVKQTHTHTHTHIMTDTQPNTITWIAIVYTYTNTHTYTHACVYLHACMHESVHACTLALNITTITRIHITSSASDSLCLLIFANLCNLLCAWKKQHTSW